MLDACTRCGKCVEVCPSVEPAGISETRSEDIIDGVLELVRTGNGPEASRKWAESCMLSGECIKACDYGVNPRFLLAMARLGIAKADNELAERRRQGVERYRDDQPRCDGAFALATRYGSARTTGPEIGVGIDAGRGAGLRVLHRLQCAQDPAHRLARPRYHGCARRQLTR